MKTFDSYEHARIANPDGDIAVNANGDLFVHTDELKLSDAFAFEVCIHEDYCNPKRGEVWRCILLPRQYVIYLYKSHCGWDTDWIDHSLLDGQSINPVQKLYTQREVGDHILRAAALEKQMNIDNLTTQTQEEKEALDIIKGVEINCDGMAESFDLIKPVHLRDYQKGVEQEAEWDGDGLPPVGAIYTTEPNFEIELLCKYSSEYVVVGEMLPKETYKGMEVVIDTMEQRDRIFRKPETPEEKEKRERLEAAEELYYTYMAEWEFRQNWSALDEKNKAAFLAIVDKTNYRKEQ